MSLHGFPSVELHADHICKLTVDQARRELQRVFASHSDMYALDWNARLVTAIRERHKSFSDRLWREDS